MKGMHKIVLLFRTGHPRCKHWSYAFLTFSLFSLFQKWTSNFGHVLSELLQIPWNFHFISWNLLNYSGVSADNLD